MFFFRQVTTYISDSDGGNIENWDIDKYILY